MFRRWLSGLKSKNKGKIELTLKVGLISLVIILIVYTIFLNSGESTNNEEKAQTTYKPQETVISGSNIDYKEYEEDTNVVDTFVTYCNEGKIKEAYELLTDECKQNLYPTVGDFKVKYCKRYFSEKKEYNLQSWVNNGNNTTYQMRITQDILSTGEYQSGGIYQDYITVVQKEGTKKININGYIYRSNINKTTSFEGINIKVNKVDVYMDYEEYTLEVTNNTENVIILDNMQQSRNSLVAVSNRGTSYSVIPNSISYIKLIVNPGETRQIEIQFNKGYTNDSNSNYILFSKIVKNYNEFIKNQTQYNDFITMKVEL